MIHPRVDKFLHTSYPADTYYSHLQTFIRDRQQQLSHDGLFHLWRSLYALGEWLNNQPLTAVTYHTLTNYEKDLWRRYTRGTLISVIGDIKQFFKWAHTTGLLPNDPAHHLRRPRYKPGKIKSAEETAVAAILDMLCHQITPRIQKDIFGNITAVTPHTWPKSDQYAARDLFIIGFLYETGARAGELRELGTAVMDRTIKQKRHVYTITGFGKTRDRDYRFTAATVQLWHIWQQIRPTSNYDHFAIIGWKNGHPPRPMLTNGISQMLVRRCQQAAVSTHTFRAHALRHGKARRSRKLVGLEMTSQLLDHSSIEVTKRYANIDDEELDNAAITTGLRPLW